jgi:tricorn protease
MRKIFLLIGYLLVTALTLNADVLRFPALSPDGNTAAFTFQGDIWLYNFSSKSYTRLTDNQAFEAYPQFSPDGKYIAFSSDRNGNNDVFVVPVTGGTPTRLTFHSADEIVNGWSPNGQYIIFQAGIENQISLYKVPVTGGPSERLFGGFWAIPNCAKISPKNDKIVFNNSWESYLFWWRKGYKGSFNADVILYDYKTNKFETMTNYEGNDLFPVWSTDGGKIYFVSDRDFNTQNIFEMDIINKSTKRLTEFKNGTVRWLNSALKAEKLIFEHEHKIGLLNLPDLKLETPDISPFADIKNNTTEWKDLTNVSTFAVSPDKKKIAAVSRGDIFVSDIEGKYITRVTETPFRESEVVWDGDSKNIYFVSDKNGSNDIFKVNPLTPKEWTPLITTNNNEWILKISPDGKYLSYVSGKKDLFVFNLKENKATKVFSGQLASLGGADYIWSPDSKWLFAANIDYWEADITAINIENQQSTKLIQNFYDESSYTISPDCKRLAFSANYEGHSFPDRTGQQDIYFLTLKKEKEVFKENLFEKLFETEPPKDSKDKKDKQEKQKDTALITIDTRDMEKRVKRVTLTGSISESDPEYSLDGKKLAYVSEGKEIFVADFDEYGNVKERTSIYSGGYISRYQWLKESSEIMFLADGKINKLDVSSKKVTAIPFQYRVEIDRNKEFKQMFTEVWSNLNEYYYDEKFHNADWKMVKKEFEPLIAACTTDEDFYLTINEMLGELNSSHLGIYPPGPEKKIDNTTASIGAVLEKDEKKGLYKIDRLIKHGPIYQVNPDLKDKYIQSINDKKLGIKDNIYEQLVNKVDKRLDLTLVDDKGKEEKISIKPVSSGAERSLLYDEWQEKNREYVHKITNDQIGYLHMKDMGWGELLKFYQNLEKESLNRKGVIFDIRFNTGGNVHDQVLNTLAKTVYSKWKIRDYKFTYQPSFGIRPKPIVLLTNEFSLSDAEMTANGFKALNLGPVVGNKTYGWLIFTSGKQLLNGAGFRIPFWGCYTLDNKDLENFGVEPDVKVINTLEDNVNEKDPQLEKAIEVILGKIK